MAASMTGSGPAVFGLFRDKPLAVQALEILRPQFPLRQDAASPQAVGHVAAHKAADFLQFFGGHIRAKGPAS